MTSAIHILADGIPPGAIFAVAVAIVVAFANVMAKKKQSESTVQQMKTQREARNRPRTTWRQAGASASDTQKEMREAAELKGLRERMAGALAIQDRLRAKQKKVKPPPMPAAPAIARQTSIASVPRAEPEALAKVEFRPVIRSEASRNIRLMLQPAGIREAFILSEVLGKPKSLRDE